MNVEGLTIRLGQLNRVSKDGGESRWLSPEEAAAVRQSLMLPNLPLEMQPGSPSACTLASIAEGAQARPVGDGRVDGRRKVVSESMPIGHRTTFVSNPLRDVLESRFSARDVGPLSIEELATVLVRSGRTRDLTIGESGFQIEHRPSPSAGGRHPCSLLVAAFGVKGLTDGWWQFESLDCSLSRVKIAPDVDSFLDQQKLLADMRHRPAAAVVVWADFKRTLSRYPSGTVHVWRDAGVLLSTIHLNATDIGLRSCITGGVDSVQGADWDDATSDVGAVVIGH